MGWVITEDDIGAGPAIFQGAKTLGTRQTAFDAEVAAIGEALKWFGSSPYLHLVIHSDSTSAIARAGHTAAGPGQQRAKRIRGMVAHLPQQYQTAEITWVKGHAGTPGNEKADSLAGKAAEKVAWSPTTSLAYIKLQISEKFRKSKKRWNEDPHHHGNEEIPPPPAKKSCMDQARNSIARTAAQIRTGHWRSAVYFKRIKKRRDDRCWFCEGKAGLYGSWSFPVWGGSWKEERTKTRPMHPGWMVGWYGRRKRRGEGALCNFPTLLPIYFVGIISQGEPIPREWRTAQAGGGGSLMYGLARRGGSRFVFVDLLINLLVFSAPLECCGRCSTVRNNG
jgi:ribonuclease HI